MDKIKEGLRTTLRLRWIIFWVLSAQYLVVYFHRVAPAVVAPDLIESFSISGASLGILASAYFYPYALMQIPVGVLSDSWGPRKTVTFFASLTALGSIAFGLSRSFDMAVTARIFVGLGLSAIFIATMKILASWFRPREFGRISSMLMAIGGLGWFTATTPLALLTSSLGWRASFIFGGAAGIILTVATWLIVADKPEDRGLPGVVEHRAAVAVNRRNVWRDLAVILGEKHFWPIAVWFIFRGAALFGFFGLWAGPYLNDVYRLSKNTAGNILSMVAWAMIFVSPLLGHLSDRTLESRKKVLVASSILNTICFVGMYIFYDTLSLPWLYIIFFLMGVTISSVGSLAITSTKELFPLEIAGTAMGTMNIFPFIGGIIFQPLMGYVLDRMGKIGGVYQMSAYREVILIYLVTSAFALAAILFCKETLGRHRG